MWQLWCIYKKRGGRRQFTPKVKTGVEEEKENEGKRVQTRRATNTAAANNEKGTERERADEQTDEEFGFLKPVSWARGNNRFHILEKE